MVDDSLPQFGIACSLFGKQSYQVSCAPFDDWEWGFNDDDGVFSLGCIHVGVIREDPEIFDLIMGVDIPYDWMRCFLGLSYHGKGWNVYFSFIPFIWKWMWDLVSWPRFIEIHLGPIFIQVSRNDIEQEDEQEQDDVTLAYA